MLGLVFGVGYVMIALHTDNGVLPALSVSQLLCSFHSRTTGAFLSELCLAAVLMVPVCLHLDGKAACVPRWVARGAPFTQAGSK